MITTTPAHRSIQAHDVVRALRMVFKLIRALFKICMAIAKPIGAFILFTLLMMTRMD